MDDFISESTTYEIKIGISQYIQIGENSVEALCPLNLVNGVLSTLMYSYVLEVGRDDK
jgi:hypothetical protein